MDIQELIDNIVEKAIERLEGANVILDFTNSFKQKKTITRFPVKRVQKEPDVEKIKENHDPTVFEVEIPEIIEIPDNLTTTIGDLQERKVLDLKRWYCMSRPQYQKSCGISSLISCWNYLFSTLGYGDLEPLTQEKALNILGIEPPFNTISFGKFTGNNTLIDWFNRFCLHFGVKGSAEVFWKLHGKNRTIGLSSEEALKQLCAGLKSERTSFIYHCYNHYMCPIGFELSPLCPADAYKKQCDIRLSEQVPWIIIGEPSKTSPVFHVKKWEDIVLDIDQQNPNFYNIRKQHLGLQMKSSGASTSGRNLHCLISFERLNS